MPSILLVVSTLLLGVSLRYTYRLVRNYHYAHKTGLPYVIIPFDPDAFIWMVLSVPLRPLMQRWLPQWLLDRVLITIWGWEFHEGTRPFERWARAQGDERTMAWVTPGNFEVNSWDPEFATEVLKRPKDFHEPAFNALFIGRFGHNILTTNGEQWARQRKMVAQVINERISSTVFNETVLQTTGLLDEVTEHGTKASAETFKAFDWMKRITIHVLSGAGMGQSVSWHGESQKPTAGHKLTYMEACKVLANAMAGPIILPQWFLDNYPSFLPGHQFIKQLGYAVREYPVHTKSMLNTERAKENDQAEAKSNIVSQMVSSTKLGGLSEDEMVSNLFVFTTAGFDTTANTLSYALALLAQDDKWQTWLFEEIDSIMPDSHEELDYATIYPKAIRVMAVMLETLRLYTPLVHIPKAAHGEQIIQTSKHTYHVPHNTTIYINSVGLHLDPAVWRNLNNDDTVSSLPDEQIFRPTRWINPDQTLFTPPSGSYLPWSLGPRNCPGVKMAKVEFTATLLTLFRQYRLDVVPLQVPGGDKDSTTREENAQEVSDRVAKRLKDSLSILTLQMNGIYDITKADGLTQGLKLKFSKRK